jgi:hypothetical protein
MLTDARQCQLNVWRTVTGADDGERWSSVLRKKRRGVSTRGRSSFEVGIETVELVKKLIIPGRGVGRGGDRTRERLTLTFFGFRNSLLD